MMPVLATLAVAGGIVAYTDLRRRAIPNWVTLGLFLLALGLSPWTHGVWAALAWGAIGMGALLPLAMLRWLGMGDVKLAAGLGALLGPLTLWAGVAAFAMAYLGSLVWFRRRSVPFGPFMVAGALVTVGVSAL